METDRRSKRKPLSDCTNILPTSRKKPPSSIPSKIPNSKTLIKPAAKPTSTKIKKDVVNVSTNSSLKSHTSIGSNNSSDSVTVPHSPAPPTPLSNADSDKSGISVDQSQRHEATDQIQRHDATDQSQRHDASEQSQRHDATDQSQRRDAMDQSRIHDAMTRKDKGKVVAELPTILISAPAPAHAQSISDPLQEASSSSPYPGHDATLTKDKGKTFADIPIIPFFAHMASKPLRIASSSPPRRTSPYEIQGVQGQNLPAQTKTDKGKTTVDASLMWKQLEIPSSRTSGCSLSEQAAYSPKLQELARKEKDKVGLESPNTEESEPSTPHSSLASPAASGTRDRPLTVYNQRRSQRVRKNAVAKKNLSSSHSEQRIRKTGVELNNNYQSSKKGSHTDPLPVHQKKRFHDKHGGPTHAMPQEEIEKLRAYYADIDAFELPEEVASDNDLE